MSDFRYETDETYTHHELRVISTGENWALPFCPCGWVGAPRYLSGYAKFTGAYRTHLEEKEKNT